MNARTLSQHYAQLTGEERLRLVLAAQARGDQAEFDSLWTSCPTMEIIVPHANFSRLFLRMLFEARDVVLLWVQLSYYVVRERLLVLALEADDEVALARKIDGR